MAAGRWYRGWRGRVLAASLSVCSTLLVCTFGEVYIKAVFSAAKAADIPVLTLADRFTGHSELFVHHGHTTPAGSEALARATADFLGSLLDGRKEGMVLGR
jgi:hypothetical protein